MTNDKAQISNQAIWYLDFEIWIFYFLLNYLWPDFDVALLLGEAMFFNFALFCYICTPAVGQACLRRQVGFILKLSRF